LFAFPAPALGATASAGLLLGGGWRVELFGLWLPTQRFAVEGTAEADFALLGGGARICAEPWSWLLGCAGMEAGRVSARAANVTHSRQGSATWVAPEIALVARWRIAGPLALAIQGVGAVPLAHTPFEIQNLGVVHRLPAATGRFCAGIEASWR
jgi:hypothetical protein